MSRAILALALLVGFYVLALGIAGVLLWIPYAEVVYTNRINPKIALMCIGAGGGILWSLRPRFDRFVAPGLYLRLDQQPKLKQVLSDVAQATGQSLPKEVYLVPDVNAFVTQRGGMLGFGSRRIMGIGLPLMSALDINEFRAVLAHEFGHYHGGDVALGPLIYRTRYSLARTMEATSGTFLETPFVAYGNMFLRVSASVSRNQEFVADAVAARTVGAAALAGGLQKAERAGVAFHLYMASEVAPMLNAGFAPPIASGFTGFIAQPAVDQALAPYLGQRVADQYDSHPPLAERLSALGMPDAGASGAGPALAVLEGVEELEYELFNLHRVGKRLKPINWLAAAESVYLPRWRDIVRAHSTTLKALAIADLPTSVPAAQQYARAFKDPGEAVISDEELTARLAQGVGAGIGLQLIQRGWKAHTAPGQPMVLTCEQDSIAPVDLAHRVLTGVEPLDTWRSTCERLTLTAIVD